MRIVNLLLTVAALASAQLLPPELPLETVISEAVASPNDGSKVGRVIAAFNRTSDTRAQLALKEVFAKSSEQRVRQTVARTLLQHGARDEAYLNELLKYAQIAINTTAPPSLEFDEKGELKKDHLSPAFERWCEENGLDRTECPKIEYERPLDVWLLAEAKDPRAIPLLRQGLGARNYLTVQVSVKGLAMLNDTDSIPVIAANLTRFHPKRAQLIAAAVAEFDDPRVGPILDRFVADPKWRRDIDESIRKRIRE